MRITVEWEDGDSDEEDEDGYKSIDDKEDEAIGYFIFGWYLGVHEPPYQIAISLQFVYLVSKPQFLMDGYYLFFVSASYLHTLSFECMMIEF